jgi:hypothetical protein
VRDVLFGREGAIATDLDQLLPSRSSRARRGAAAGPMGGREAHEVAIIPRVDIRGHRLEPRRFARMGFPSYNDQDRGL